MALILYVVLTGIFGFLSLIFNHLFLRDEKKRQGIEEVTDSNTGRRRQRILEGTLDQGRHDDLYNLGQALDSRAVFIESLIPLEKSVLIEALVSLTKVHPLLRMKCEWEKTKRNTYRYLTEMEKLTTNELIYSEINKDRGEWVEILEDELLQGFDLSSGPMWRVVRLKEEFDCASNKYHNTILFTFHHAICDGVSVMNYIDKLLEVMDKMLYGDLKDEDLEPLPLLEPLPVLVKHHIELPWTQAISLKVKDTLQTVFRKPKRSIFLDRFPPPVQSIPTIKPKTRVIPSCISEEDTEIFLKNCKKHKCTVGGALAAFIAVTVRKLLEDTGTSDLEQITIGLPVNTRNGCKPVVKDKDFGCYIGMIYCHCGLVGEIVSLNAYVWELARNLSIDIKEKIKNCEQYEIHKRMKYAGYFNSKSLWESAKKDLNNAGRYPNFELSNVGNFDLDKQRAFKITETYFAVAQEISGPVMTASAMTVSKKLSWSVVYSNLAVNQEQANGFSKGIAKLMNDVGCKKE